MSQINNKYLLDVIETLATRLEKHALLKVGFSASHEISQDIEALESAEDALGLEEGEYTEGLQG